MIRRLIIAITVALLLSMLRMTVHAAPPEDGGAYVVRAGDTLTAIALRNGTTVAALLKANGIKNQNYIYKGQRLVLPGQGAPKPVPAAQQAAATTRSTKPTTTEVKVAPPPPSDSLSIVSTMPAPSDAPTTGKWIDINLSKQRLTAYDGTTPVYTTAISSGLPTMPTVQGKFPIRVKLRSQHMSGPGYFLPNVPHVMYFYSAYAIHGAYWHTNFGRPQSHGCVNLPLPAADWVYNWASVGTLVYVHK